MIICEKEFNVIEQNFNTPLGVKTRWHIELKVKKRILWFWWNKTYQIRNVQNLDFMGMKNEYLPSNVIYFFNKGLAELFLNNNIHRFTKQGLYLGGMSNGALHKYYEQKLNNLENESKQTI